MAPRMWKGYARSDMVAMKGGGRRQRGAYSDRLVGAWLWRRGHVEFRDRISSSTHDFVDIEGVTFLHLYVREPLVVVEQLLRYHQAQTKAKSRQ